MTYGETGHGRCAAPLSVALLCGRDRGRSTRYGREGHNSEWRARTVEPHQPRHRIGAGDGARHEKENQRGNKLDPLVAGLAWRSHARAAGSGRTEWVLRPKRTAATITSPVPRLPIATVRTYDRTAAAERHTDTHQW